MEMLKIIDFAESRGLKANTVTAWILRQRAADPVTWESALSIEKKDQYIDIESDAFRLLEAKYPIPKPVEVINRSPDDISKIAELTEENKRLALRVADQAETASKLYQALADQQGKVALLEVREQQLDESNAKLKEFEATAKEAGEKNAVLSAEKAILENEKKKLEEKLDEMEAASKMGFFAYRRWLKSKKGERNDQRRED